MNNVSIPNDFKQKSFWEKPEGVTGMIFLVAAIFGIGYGLFFLLPFIITLLENTVYAAFLFLILGCVLYLLFDKKTHKFVSYLFKSVMRSMTGIFITIDPIGVLKNYIDDLSDNINNMGQQIKNLAGQLGTLKNIISNTDKEMQKNLQTMEIAQKKGDTGTFILQSRQAGRLKESNFTYQDMYKKMEILYKILSKMKDTSDILLQDMNNEVKIQEQRYEIMKKSYNAFKSAMKVVNGDSESREMYERTMEYLANDYGQKLGEIEHFIEVSGSFINGVDIQNGVYEEDAMKMLQEWEKKGDSILLGDQKQQILLSNTVSQTINTSSNTIEVDFTELLK